MVASFLIQNISELFSMSSMMQGGKSNKNSFQSSQISNKQTSIVVAFIMILIAILLKGMIVYLLYNYLVPKIKHSLSSKNETLETIEDKFKPLTFTESVLLVIFTNTLFTF
jgi:hypothetical protein